VNPDFSDLLKLFNGNHVKYLIVGGYAVAYHSEPRYTKDLDLWIEATPENAALVFQALRQFGAPLKGLAPLDFTQEGYVYSVGIPPVRVDVLMSLSGITFEDAWNTRVESEFGGEPTQFISREHLLRAKRASGRPQDLMDASALETAEKIVDRLSEPAGNGDGEREP